MYRSTILVLIITFVTAAQTQLSGMIGGITLDSTGNPYIVSDNITIPQGKTAIISSGCVLLFKPFTGVIIEGSLIVNGTLQSPAVFTSINDARFNPTSTEMANPFDWNGVLVKPGAGKINFSNIVVAYSVYGIKSQLEALSMQNAMFQNNGQFNFTVNESIKNVVDGIPFNYGDQPQSKNDNIVSSPRFPYGAAIALGSIGVIGTVISAVAYSDFVSFSEQYATERNTVRQTELKEQQKNAQIVAIAAGSVGGTGLLVGTALFIRTRIKQKEKLVTISPYIDFSGVVGLTLSRSF